MTCLLLFLPVAYSQECENTQAQQGHTDFKRVSVQSTEIARRAFCMLPIKIRDSQSAF